MELIMLTGIPGCGKSTVADSYKERGYHIYSSDAIREELYGKEDIQGNAAEVFNFLTERIKKDLKQGQPCVMDATNLSRKRRRSLLSTIAKYPGKRICIIVLASPQECLERNAKRSRHVPEERLYEMLCSFETPYYYEGWDQIEAVCTGEPYVFPRADAQDMPQDNPHHTLTLGAHLDAARDYCVKNGFSENVQEAAWYHDIGKYYTKRFVNRKGEIRETAHFYGHENYGAWLYLCEKSADGFEKDAWEKNLYIANLINWHMRPLNAWQYSTAREEKDRKLMGETMYADLMRLHQADRQAH